MFRGVKTAMYHARTTETVLICIVPPMLTGRMSLGRAISLGRSLDFVSFKKAKPSKQTEIVFTFDINVMVAAKNLAKSNGFGTGPRISFFRSISIEVHSLLGRVSSKVYSWTGM